MPKTSVGVPPDLVKPLAQWRAAHPGRPIADLIRLALLGNPPPSTTTSGNGHRDQADEHEAHELAELRAAVDDLARTVDAMSVQIGWGVEAANKLRARVDEHEQHHAEQERDPIRDLADYQQRLEDSAEARMTAYHRTLCAALTDDPRHDWTLTAAEAASIWACVTQSARDRLRGLVALGMATVDDTGRAHVWTIAPSTSTSTSTTRAA